MSVVRAAKLAADQVRILLYGAPPHSGPLLLDWIGDELASIQSKPQDWSYIMLLG